MKNIQKLAEEFIKGEYKDSLKDNIWSHQKNAILKFAQYLTEHLKPVEPSACCEKCAFRAESALLDGSVEKIYKDCLNPDCPCHKDKGEEKEACSKRDGKEKCEIGLNGNCIYCDRYMKLDSPQPKETKEIEELKPFDTKIVRNHYGEEKLK